ncbi:MAG: Eco57I restriction-modification methylase domain-containing protein, partial [Opitutaceae bacterium]
QVPLIDGKRHGKEVNLYKLFLERSVRLLRQGGECGIVIPSSIYTDLGAMQLRAMLFSETAITGLFGFENRKLVFEGVDTRFKFVVLTFRKGGTTKTFPAAFMRHDVGDLARFPDHVGLPISIDLVKRLSPGSWSVMEFKSETDVIIAKKALRFPLLSEQQAGKWNLELHREFNMTDDANLFHEKRSSGRLLLFEGKMIWHFDCSFSEPRFWIGEKEGRKALLGKKSDTDQTLPYQTCRLAYRDVAASTNERTMISTVLPSGRFTGNTLVNSTAPIDVSELVFVSTILNSFVIDYLIRQKVTNHCNMFYVYQLPMPRLAATDAGFWPLVWRAARLLTPADLFSDLRKELSAELKRHRVTLPLGASNTRGLLPATDVDDRARLRAEIDGLVAHLYGLTEEEFRHVLSTFPLVPEPVKLAAHNAWRDVQLGLVK